jgi:SPX domain protein involved in polyphosphate accumulation
MVTADFSRNRFEVKYIVPVHHLPQLRAQLAGILAIDDNSGGAEIGYFNQSIYFDSQSLKYYRDKQEGLNERVKVRLRLYRRNLFSTPDGRFLEFKNRIDKIVSKTRTSVDQEMALKLVNQCRLIGSRELDTCNQCLMWFYYLVRRDAITPVLTTLYKREAYRTVLYQDVRLTIDTNVRASSKCSLDLNLDSFHNILDPRYSILELKYCGKVPRLIVDRIASLCLTQVTFSKYGRSVETLYDVMAGHAGKAEFSSLDR